MFCEAVRVPRHSRCLPNLGVETSLGAPLKLVTVEPEERAVLRRDERLLPRPKCILRLLHGILQLFRCTSHHPDKKIPNICFALLNARQELAPSHFETWLH